MAVSNTHRYAFALSPSEDCTGKEGHVAVDSIILPLAQDFPEATPEGPRIYSPWAWNHPTAELFYFAGKYPWFLSEGAKVKFEAVPINISKNIEKPGFDSTGVHCPESVENTQTSRGH
jgi:hypothetical protein